MAGPGRGMHVASVHSDDLQSGPSPRRVEGVWGKPFIDLAPYLDLTALPELDREICLGLAQVPVGYTGGSHRSMGIMPRARAAEALVDDGEIIASLDDEDFDDFCRLSDDPGGIDRARRAELAFGEERDLPLSRRQMRWLEVRHGVYFPWKFYVELIPNRAWGDKSTGTGKEFTRLAKNFFPKTIAFAESLPFREIGRCNIMGLAAHDHGTVHTDSAGEPQDEPDHFVTFCPRSGKRLFVWDEASGHAHFVDARAFWFNDHDFHGVAADPFFRYSVRVDGVFRDDFLERLRSDHGGG